MVYLAGFGDTNIYYEDDFITTQVTDENGNVIVPGRVGIVYTGTWADGKTSFTTRRKTKWNYGKLYKEQLCDIRIE